MLSIVSTLPIFDVGEGPAVLLLHGAPTTPEHMYPLGRSLSDAYRVLIPALPGYGGTPALRPYDLDRSHALVEQALLERGVQRLFIAGFSGGAYRAIALACRGQLRVDGLICLAGFGDFTGEESERLQKTAAALRTGIDFAPLVTSVMLSPAGQRDPQAVAEVHAWARAVASEPLAEELAALAAGPDLRAALAALGIPVLARVGQLDLSVPPIRSERILQAVPTARLEVVPGVGHALLAEDEAATILSVRAFLDACAAREAGT